LVWIFFVAGADAGTIVLGSMSAGGVMNPNRLIKLFWGAIMGALAAILLLAGGLDALQNGAILAATPFAILMCLMCWCLYKTIRRDYREEREQIREIMAHDQNVEKQQMQELLRRHEAGEPVGQVSDSSNGGLGKD
jgi:glycine betaine transporter